MNKVVINLHEGVFNLEEKPEGLEIVVKEFVSDSCDEDLKIDADGIKYIETVL